MRHLFALIAAVAACMLLVLACHLAGFASPSRQEGYPLTNYLTSCISWPFAALWLLASAALGAGIRSPWGVAAGMTAPLVVAAAIEVVRDPTSHNLLGLEVALLWVPALLLAFGAARTGHSIGKRIEHRRNA